MTDGLRVNFSGKEAASEARSVDLMPRGEYHVCITDIELRESQSEKNYGKEYWAIEMTIQEGQFDGRKLWANCMLFEGALYTLSQLLKSQGIDPDEGDFDVPPAEFFIGKHAVVTVVVKGKSKNKETGEEYEAKNDVKGFKKYDEATYKAPKAGAVVAKGGRSSLLP